MASRAAEFRTFRSETARLGTTVSIEAANEQGNNEANRANRKALNDQLVAFGKRNEEVGNRLSDEAAAFTRQVQTASGLARAAPVQLASVSVAGVVGRMPRTKRISFAYSLPNPATLR